MKLKFRLLLIIILLPPVGYARQKWAFLVGISNYDTALTSYQWNNINGIEDVNLLSPILFNQGFSIITLLDKEATYKNIVTQLSDFSDNIKKGDIVYLHFSAHGQPVEDTNGDEEDGWDEAIVPIDAYKIYKKDLYDGNRHLIDDQLNKYVKRLREKIGPKGFLYVTIDACHAGTSSRANDETVRGTRVGFTNNNKVYKPSSNKRSHYKVESSAKLANVVFVEACRPDQVNTEIKVEGKRFGPLSYNIAQVLSKSPLSTEPMAFLNNLKESISENGHWPNNQNLVIETSF